MTRTLLAAGVLGALTWGTALADGPASFAEAKSMADAGDRPLLVDFYAEWCGPCQRFLAALDADESLRSDIAEEVVLYKVDAEKGEGIQMARAYEVSGYPTFVLMNADGELLDRWSGYGDPSGFLENLSRATDDPMTVDARIRRFREAPTAADATKLGKIRHAMGYYGDAVAYYERAAALDPAVADEMRTAAFDAVAEGTVRRKMWEPAEVKARADALLGGSLDDTTHLDVVYSMYTLARRTEDMSLYTPYVPAALERSARFMEIDEPSGEERWYATMHQNLRLHEAQYVDRDLDRAVEIKRSTMPEGWMDDAAQLNAFAWWCFENEVNLDEAETLARKGVELSEAGTARANILDTLAEICNLKGDCGEALEIIRRAAAEDPSNEYIQRQVARFEGLVAEQKKS